MPTPVTDKARKSQVPHSCPGVMGAAELTDTSLRDHYVKFPYATVYGGRKAMTTSFLRLSQCMF